MIHLRNTVAQFFQISPNQRVEAGVLPVGQRAI